MPEITVAEAQALYEDSDAAHAFDHVLRVTRLAEHLALAEGADSQVVRTAALLHDCAHAEPEHQLVGAQKARGLLCAKKPVFIDAVAHCIESHRFSRPPEPQTIEAKCLCDADNLDAIGAIGVARAYAHAGHHGARLWSAPLAELRTEIGENVRAYRQKRGATPDYTPVHELICKLESLTGSMYTDTAHRIAAERHAFMLAFFERLDAEALGKA